MNENNILDGNNVFNFRPFYFQEHCFHSTFLSVASDNISYDFNISIKNQNTETKTVSLFKLHLSPFNKDELILLSNQGFAFT